MTDQTPELKIDLKLYNTLTRSKETFKPIDPHNVRMYVCGPTVYDFAHIGNARPVIVFDVLFRLLRHLYGAEHVTYVRNITDVDDKINARALRDFGADFASGKMGLNEAIRAVTQKTADRFQADATALGCLEPTHQPRATEHIPGMVTMIQTLLDKGHAYVATGSEGAEVLFDVTSMADYGALSKRKLEEQQAGARVAVEPHKKNPADFVLWKESSASEPGWEGAFDFEGRHVHIHGRPGWHIECSVMSKAHLGEVFDIHGGGLDLIFPHHENEIAQSRCAHGSAAMANIWMHNGFLQVEGQKMSKSLGNFVTIAELLETDKLGGHKWPGEVLRLAMLMTHYREPIDFSVRRLEEAASLIDRLSRALTFSTGSDRELDVEVATALADDLNTVAAIRRLQGMATDILAANALEPSTVQQIAAKSAQKVFKRSVEVLGLHLDVSFSAISIEPFIQTRLALIAAKNFAEADRIRDELLAQGIQLKDGKDPATGERITTWEVKR